jgi:uncharacterized membrane protein
MHSCSLWAASNGLWSVRTGAMGSFLWIATDVFWPYLAGTAVLLVGTVMLIRAHPPSANGINRIYFLAPLFFSIPLAVFGAQHFTAAVFVAKLVPSWIPGHLFWTYFVGTALIAAAFSIVTGIHTRLAAALVGVMLLLFVLLMHIPAYASAPHNRFTFAVALRDLSFSGGAFALAANRTEAWHKIGKHVIAGIARFFIGIPLIFFGIENFLHPSFVPSVPLDRITPAWIPAHLFWSYVTGIVFFASGIGIVAQIKARLAATASGILTLLLVLFVYLPMLVAAPADIAVGLNYAVDTLLLSGSLLLLGNALPETDRVFTSSRALLNQESALTSQSEKPIGGGD